MPRQQVPASRGPQSDGPAGAALRARPPCPWAQENTIQNAAPQTTRASAGTRSDGPAQAAGAGGPVDWRNIDLVVFDVDGTLYDQRRLRLRMLRELVRDALRTLRRFRHVREALGDAPVDDFMRQQYARTATLCNASPEQVEALTTEWMEQRPLTWIGDCRYPHVDRLFERMQALGKQVAVFSDYPAVDKLRALGLRASPVVCATDPGVARLKPDARGLLQILAQTGVSAQRALMIGDRFDRDGAAARQAGVRALIRHAKPHPEFATFRRYDDAVFAPLWAADAGAPP
jgi:phosphoglycolate phosphatase/putative hydrolase of the HAD superfamily